MESDNELPIDLSCNRNNNKAVPPLIPLNRLSKKRAAPEEWDLRLDRAHSVPHLRSLPPLLRCKSLSESRIAGGVGSSRPLEWVLEHEQEFQRQRLLQVIEHEQEFQRQRFQQIRIDVPNESIYRFYPYMLTPYHPLEQQHQDKKPTATITSQEYSTSEEELSKKMPPATAARSMSGKNIRTGAGASAATLQILRKKIQERQQLRATTLK